MKTNENKAQGLPLNTIVLAILVIIVLLVVIVFFTSKMGSAGDSLDDTSSGLRNCAVGSYIIPIDKYSDASPATTPECEGDDVRIYGADVPDKQICCATPKTTTP